MNKIIICLLNLFSIFIVVHCYGQKTSPLIRQNDSIGISTNNSETTILPPTDINVPTTLKNNEISTTTDNSIVQKQMPWIAALVIGILSAFVNFWTANRLRQSNERNLNKQFENAERNLQMQIQSSERNLHRQIESNERNMQRQIETSKETTLIQFKSTIATKNRQEWINDIRLSLTEYLSSASLMAPISKTQSEDLPERSQLLKQLSLAKAKLNLLLNEKKPEQKKLSDCIEALLQVVINGDKDGDYTKNIRTERSNTIHAAIDLFETHWNKIKNLN